MSTQYPIHTTQDIFGRDLRSSWQSDELTNTVILRCIKLFIVLVNIPGSHKNYSDEFIMTL